MWASENEGHLQAPYESAFEFCVLTYYLLTLVMQIKEEKKKKTITNKKRSLVKIKLKCQCVIIKGKHCSATQRNRMQAGMRRRAHARRSWLHTGSRVSQLAGTGKGASPEAKARPYLHRGDVKKGSLGMGSCLPPPSTRCVWGRTSTSGSHRQRLALA